MLNDRILQAAIVVGGGLLLGDLLGTLLVGAGLIWLLVPIGGGDS